MNPAKLLIAFGVILIAVGALLWIAQRLGLGRLPGDIIIQRENFTFAFPLTSCLLISAVLTLILWLISRTGGRPPTGSP